MTERSPGVWRLRVYIGRDPATGKRRQISRTVKGGKREANKAMGELLARVADENVVGSRATLNRLLDAWLERQTKDPTIRASTVSHNRSVASRAIRPGLGHKRLEDITSHDVETWYGELHGRYSQGTARGTRAVLRAALNEAIAWGWISKNPVGRLRGTHTPSRAVMTPEDVRTILVSAEQDDLDLAALLYVAAVTGMRRGELCGLRWSDLDWDAQTIVIERQVVPGEGGQHVTPTKTANVRTIEAPQAFVCLRRHRERQAALYGAVLEDGYIFGIDGGAQPAYAKYVTSFFAKHAKVVGVTARLHDLRHFAVTQVVTAGHDPTSAAAYFGHTPQVMLGTYSHRNPEAERRLAVSLDLGEQ